MARPHVPSDPAAGAPTPVTSEAGRTTAGDDPVTRRDPPLRVAVLVLVGLVLARAAVYVVLGPGFVGDDWSLAGAMHLDGHQGRFILESRPGSYLVFTAVYGIGGTHPVAVFAAVTGLYLGVVLALHALTRRFLAPATALVVTGVWVLLPTHTTIAVWGATTNSLVGMTLALVGLLLLTHGRWAPATVAMVASVLSYELSTPLLLLGAIVLPARWQWVPSEKAVGRSARAITFAAVGASALWAATHSVYDEEFSLLLPNPVLYASAHYGSGLFGTASAPGALRLGVLAVLAVVLAAACVAWFRGERGRESGPGLVAIGLAVMASAAWIAFVLPIGSHGVVDRLFAVSTIGSAIALVGAYRYLRSHKPALARAGVSALVAVCLAGQFVALRSWSEAGADAVALLRHLERHHPDAAEQRFVLGPAPPYRNGVVGVSGGHGKWALWTWFDQKGGGLRIIEAGDDFVAEEGEVMVTWPEVLAEAGR